MRVRQARKSLNWKNSAVTASMLITLRIILDIEDRLKLLPKKHSAPSNLGFFDYDGNVVGGLLLGAGMAMTGACPGTSLVQTGAGMANGVLVVIGGVLGAMAFVKLQPVLKTIRERLLELEISRDNHSNDVQTTAKTPRDMATAIGVQPVVLLLVWVPSCLAVMQLALWQDHTTRVVPQSGLVRPAYGGLLIGAAQLVTTLLTGHSIGASAAYQDIASWILFPSSSEYEHKPALMTRSVIFSGGIISAAAALRLLVHGNGTLNSAKMPFIEPQSALQTVAGGLIMVIGARTAGGCTSGHGISGLAKFSMTSLVTTTSLFSAGILTAKLMA